MKSRWLYKKQIKNYEASFLIDLILKIEIKRKINKSMRPRYLHKKQNEKNNNETQTPNNILLKDEIKIKKRLN